MEKILILAGSESDRKIAGKAEDALREFGIEYKTEIASAHRNPGKLEKVLKESPAEIIIAIAGLSAHLPGVCASKTVKPVIGVPVNVKLEGLDALLSIMNMPPGVPVATVGIDNGKNAALLAIEILAVSDANLRKKMLEYREKMNAAEETPAQAGGELIRRRIPKFGRRERRGIRPNLGMKK